MLPSLSSEQIVALRPSISRPQPSLTPIEVIAEMEAADTAGNLAEVTTILLRGSECSFRCTMCDLWKATHLGPTPAGNIPAQIQSALSSCSMTPSPDRMRWIKLYNASNFFAPYNVPTEDLPAVAELVRLFDRVVVENHPLLVSARIPQFAARLDGRLEVAMGLETVEPAVLESLNKQVTVEQIRRATERLVDEDIDVRLFVLLRPPGLGERAGIESCLASIDAARQWGARHVSIIPLRGGNGALEHLQSQGHFEPPLASSLETVLSSSLRKSPLVITADTWDWNSLRGVCSKCAAPRLAALERSNLTQIMQPILRCTDCEPR